MTDRTFKVATFYNEGDRLLPSRVRTYTRAYNPEWDGCVIFEIEAPDSKTARRHAIDERIELEQARAADPPVDNRGLHRYRYAANPSEEAFADAWLTQQKDGDTLGYLLSPPETVNPSRSFRERTTTQRDRTVAATVVQWLGSPVGQDFLAGLGYYHESES